MWHNKINNVIWTIFKLKTVYIFPFSFNPIKIEKSDKVSCDLMPIAFFCSISIFLQSKIFESAILYCIFIHVFFAMFITQHNRFIS